MSLLRAPIAISKNSLSTWIASCECSLSCCVGISHDNVCNLLPFQKPLYLLFLFPFQLTIHKHFVHELLYADTTFFRRAFYASDLGNT